MENKSFDWFLPITALKGVGNKITEKLHQLNIKKVGDLLLHCPFRYEDRTRLTPIKDIKPEETVVIQGQIIDIVLKGKSKKRALITLSDQTGLINLLFFNFHSYRQKIWQKGTLLRCYGQVKTLGISLQLIHPDCEIVVNNNPLPLHLTPIYPTVAGLAQGWLRKTIQTQLAIYKQLHKEKDHFRNVLMPFVSMLPWLEALECIHQPKPGEEQDLILRKHPAFKRLIGEELYSHYISLKTLRNNVLTRTAPRLQTDEKLLNDFLTQLPFGLTAAQTKVCAKIKEDLSQTKPMQRLVQGDVGSGKTVVGAIAALSALSSGCQVAVMAPTEILAQQLHKQFVTWFLPFGFRCEILTSKLKTKAKRNILENITLGLTDVIIGTHALFQEEVKFKQLGLVIIDEQHRFGVHQRLALQDKGNSALTTTYPHQLIMTATPIPRTLAMSHYAHLEISIIDSLPPYRQPIRTLTIPQKRRHEVIEKLKGICSQKQQVYWVCTLIEESEEVQCQAAQTTKEFLEQALPFKVGFVHGKMDSTEKENVMQAFYEGSIQILVATTVIEVGVNVPNATLIVIENPERLGLAQLHQLRGRVGRGDKESFCILLYLAPLSKMAQARLKIMRETNDGFVIAEEDLTLRGPGEVLGTRQTGEVQFKIADFARDKEDFALLPSWENLLNKLSQSQIEMICLRWDVKKEYAQA